MVHKPVSLKGVRDDTFENDVKMYGTSPIIFRDIVRRV